METIKERDVPIVSIAEQDGQKGIRLCVNDIDIFIEAHDLDDSKRFCWADAMKRLKAEGKSTLSHKQGLIMASYKAEINTALREIGGAELRDYYWSATEFDSTYAWYVNFSAGDIYGGYSKYSAYVVRPVAEFKDK